MLDKTRHPSALGAIVVGVLAVACSEAHVLDDGGTGARDGGDAWTGPADVGRATVVDGGTAITGDATVVGPTDAETSDAAAPDAGAATGCDLAPAGGAVTAGALVATEYLDMSPLAGTRLDVFRGQTIGASCDATCTSGATDSMGQLRLDAPVGGWLGVHELADSNDVEARIYQVVWTPPSTRVARFAPSTVSVMAALLGRTAATANGTLSGVVVDCAGGPVANAELRVFIGSARVATGSTADRTSPRVTGIQGTSPTRSGLTSASGAFLGVNIPPGDTMRVEAWLADASGALQMIGCEQGVLTASSITVMTLGPLRSDYPAGSPCDLATP